MATTQKNRNGAVRKLFGRLMQRMRKRRQKRTNRQEISSDDTREENDPPDQKRRSWECFAGPTPPSFFTVTPLVRRTLATGRMIRLPLAR